MTTPVEHRAASPEATADTHDLPAQRPEGDSAMEAAGQSIRPVRPAVPAERRGKTDIPGRVVSRIAARAAGEVAGVREVRERKPLAFGGGTHAAVDGELTTLHLDVSVEYPTPLLQVTEAVRRHVADRVHMLTGLHIGHIDIDVTDVLPPQGEDHG
ncbi:Asp23/Gls24 family envelope stress response protein [Streptosporangium sp. NBC_01639]|uniref:Asp23/Gls24 family envelope stress response protein n=1 Tax=unclassified Streptosporangium TaxID=2632669 RepID=UPI002DD94EC9|nr:Asp23/Gls24 family envelope stress response protein [Streptosporangium sp. NBC_01756]WSC88808.1 Asp23/Gls24 family envelope stress response protein [Streptosporangium sp. NBC_01756]WTD52505.1 Asp23/Gls24 family envelope stress response protein [Streptosporangium sp. NBC_01639]